MGNKFEADVRAFNAALGRVLKSQRILRGKGQADLVDDDARLSLATVGRIERGAGATTVQLISLAGALDLPLSTFIAHVEAEVARGGLASALTQPEADDHQVSADVADLELRLRLEDEAAGAHHVEVNGE